MKGSTLSNSMQLDIQPYTWTLLFIPASFSYWPSNVLKGVPRSPTQSNLLQLDKENDPKYKYVLFTSSMSTGKKEAMKGKQLQMEVFEDIAVANSITRLSKDLRRDTCSSENYERRPWRRNRLG